MSLIKSLADYCKSRSHVEWTVLFLIAITGITISYVVYRGEMDSEESVNRINFEMAANRRLSHMIDSLGNFDAIFGSLQDFYNASSDVSREEFSAFVGRILNQGLGLQALEWLPRVTNDNLASFVEAAREDGFPDFEIKEKDPSGKLVKRSKQEEYFPVYYVEPYHGNELALGFDAASNPIRRAILDQSRDTGLVIATEQIRLVQGEETQSGFVVFIPVYTKGASTGTVEQRRNSLKGFVAGVFTTGDFFSQSLQKYDPESINVSVFEREASGSQKLIYGALDTNRTNSPANINKAPDSLSRLHVEKQFDVWGRKWTAICVPEAGSSKWLVDNRTPLAVLFSFLIFTGLVLSYVSFLHRGKEVSIKLAEAQREAQLKLEDQARVREEALLALRQNKELLNTVLQAAPVGIGFAKNRVLSWSNEAFCKNIMYSQDQLMGSSTRILYETDSEFRRVSDLVYPEIENRGQAEVETRFLRKDGSSIDILLSLAAVDRQNLSAGVVFAALDITERKKDEKLIQENAVRILEADKERTEILQRLELALRGADLGVWDWHVQSGDLFQDEIWHAQLGYSVDDVERNIISWESRIHPDDKPAAFKALNDCLEGVSPFYSVEHRLLTKSGDWKWILTRGKVLERDEQGLPVRMLGTHLDIDMAKKADQALRKSEKLFRVLTETIDDVFWMSDPIIQTLLYASPAYEKVWGKSLEDLHKDPGTFREPVHPDDVNRLMEYFGNSNTQIQGYSLEYRILIPDGSTRWILERAYPINDETGRPEFMCGICTDITDRKNMEEEYKKFKTISDKSNSGNAISDLDGNITYLNDSFARMHGHCVSECMGKHLSMFHTEEQLPAIRASMETLISKGSFETLELWHKRKDQTVFPTLMNGALISDSKGNPQLLSATVIDITEQKNAEQDLHDSEQLFKKLFYIAPDSMAISRISDGKYVDINEKFTSQTGFTREDSLDRTSLDIGLWVNPEDFQSVYDQISQKGKIDNFETQFRLKDGTIRTGLLSATIVELDKMPHVLGVVRDIDDIKKAQVEHDRLATAVDQATERVVITDPAGKIVYVNPAFERSTGYSKDEAIGQSAAIIGSGKHDRSFYEDMWKTISGGNVWRGRIINKHKDGHLLHEKSTITPVKNSTGTIVNYVQIATDITAEENLRDQLAQSQKMEAIGTLASGIAHDFNNIVQAIMGYTELVMDGLPIESPAYTNLEKVMRAAQRSAEMVKQILTFSRRSTSEFTTIDIGPLTKEGLKFLKAAIPSNIEIKENIQPNLGKILANPTQIHQVLMNLCINASQAIKAEKGAILVELEELDLDIGFTSYNPPLLPGKHLRLRVSDTGGGIPPNIVDKIFDPYFTTKESGEGTGLGLSVVHGILVSCNGAITVSSDHGKGTTFYVYFPVVQDPGKAEKRDLDSKDRPLGSEQVLVVDDETILVELVASKLKRLGYKVTATTDPQEALRLLLENPRKFKVVVTDLMMPKMSGIELAEKIATAWPDIPVVICTGWGELMSNEQITKAGIRVIVRKPAARDEIAQAIRTVLDGGDANV